MSEPKTSGKIYIPIFFVFWQVPRNLDGGSFQSQISIFERGGRGRDVVGVFKYYTGRPI